MTIDARAYTWCNLGPLSDEGASIAEDHAQGAGVLMVKGVINLEGIHRPYSGTVVKLAYSDGQSWIAQFPLRLRVLSCFSDPIRNKTSVSVGCDFAYYDNRKEPVTVEAEEEDDEENIPDIVRRVKTPALSAAYLAARIFGILGIPIVGGIPLTNVYVREEFDMSGGYVEELGKLCVSEGYICYMNEDGYAEIVQKDRYLSVGRVLTADDLIDLNPINAGDLPGDAVYGRYTSLKLRAPKDEDEPDPNDPDPPEDPERRKRDWELEESFGQLEVIFHDWTRFNLVNTFEEVKVKDRDNLDVCNPDAEYPKEYLPEGSFTKKDPKTGEIKLYKPKLVVCSHPMRNIASHIPYSKTETQYDSKDRVTYRYTERSEPFGLTVSESSYTYADNKGIWAFSLLDLARNGNNDPGALLQEVTIERKPIGPVCMSLGLEQPYDFIRALALSGETGSYISSKRVVLYEVNSTSGVTRTTTLNFVPYMQTTEGSETISRIRDRLDSYNQNARLPGEPLVALATTLVQSGSETRIRTEREFGIQRRPREVDRKKEENKKEQAPPDVIEEARLSWAVGSAASQTAVELSPPYAPDDRIVGSTSGPPWSFSVRPSYAAQKVLNYGRIENRYLFGHRNGVGIQVLPEALPPKPLSVVYIRLKGCTGAFLVNGRTWNLDPNGATVTCDALFWGAIDGTVADAWFPLPPNISALPTPVAITNNSNPVPANAIPIPSGFNFNNPDLNALFGALPANTAPIPPATIAPAIIIKPYRETIFCGAGSGSGAIADPQFWIAQPPGEYTAGSGSGVLATAVAGPSTSLGARWTSGTTFTAAAGAAGPGHGGGERWVSGSVFTAGVGSDGLVRAPGANWTSATTFTAGAAEDGLELAPGARWTSGSTFTAGAGSDDLEQAPGAAWASASTFLAGAGDDGIEQGAGANWSSGSIFTAGAGDDGLEEAPGANWSSGSVFYAGVGGVGDGSGAGAAWASGSTFAAGAGAVDPVALYLPFAGNFNDQSSAALTPTVFGNAYVTNRQGVFDGAGDYVTFPGAPLVITNDFTIELWAYFASLSDQIVMSGNHSSDNNIQLFRVNGTNISVFINANYATIINSASSGIAINNWHHLVLCRSGSSTRLFVDGIQRGSTATSWAGSFSPNVIGQQFFNGNLFLSGSPGNFSGRLRELRVTRQALYTANFTPPASALGANWTSSSVFNAQGSTNTDPYFSTVSLLLHFDGANGSTTFIDSSSNNVALTRVGNGTISTAQARFGQSYLSASGGDRLIIPASSLFTFAGDFTVEVWCYQINRIQYDTLLELGTYDNGIMLRNGPSGASIYVNNQNIPYSFGNLNEWIHIAVVRVGTTVTAYANGVSVGTAYVAGIVNSTGSQGFIGDSTHAPNRTFLGYIDELRISKVARYTANFTPPTGPHPLAGTPDPHFSSVSLLLPFDGDFTDRSSNGLIITDTSAVQISTTVKKWGSGSLRTLRAAYVSKLSLPSSSALDLTGDFTIEFDLYALQDRGMLMAFGSNQQGVLILNKDTTAETGANAYKIYLLNNAVELFDNVDIGLVKEQWRQIALTRSGSILRLFGEGTLYATATDSSTYSVATVSGAFNSINFDGYFDNIRITKGVCRYTSNFTPAGPHPLS